MSPGGNVLQRVGRLTPLADAHAILQRIATPVRPATRDTREATGCILAADIKAVAHAPETPRVMRDGWAVAADLVADASPYAPVLLQNVQWVNAGDALPPRADAVLPPDHVSVQSEVIGAVTKGDGVSAAGDDAELGQVLLQAGHRLRASDVAALTLLGVHRLEVRAPRVAVIAANARVRDASLAMIASAVGRFGGMPITYSSEGLPDNLKRTLHEVDADGIFTIGGTGCGASDRAISLMREVGEVYVHGLAISPGETCAIGSMKGRPVLMLPGRLDAALSAWLLIGQFLLGRLADTAAERGPREVSLSRKISSTLGMSEAVLIRETADGFVPIGSKSFPLRALAAAHGWALVPPDSEGFPAGARIALHSLP